MMQVSFLRLIRLSILRVLRHEEDEDTASDDKHQHDSKYAVVGYAGNLCNEAEESRSDNR